MISFRSPQPHQLEALRELASLTCIATHAAEIEICLRSGATSRTIIREGNAPADVAVHRREATASLPIGRELVVVASFEHRPDADVQKALSQAAMSAVAVLGTSVVVEPGRPDDSMFSLFDAAPMPIWIYDIQTLRFLDVNAFAITRYGYSREEFLSMTIAEVRPESDKPVFHQQVRAMRRGFHSWKPHHHRWKNGQLRDVAVVSYDIMYQDRPARLVMVDDVTEQRRAEQTRELLLAAVENLDELVILFQQPKRGRRLPRITFVNSAFERMFGWERGHLLTGEGVREIATGINAVVSDALVEVMSQKRSSQLELDVHDRDGKVLRLEFSVEPVRMPESTDTTHWVAIARDVTQRRALAERSVQAQRLEAMGMLAGGIAHDFNNLVVAISGFSQLALNQLRNDTRVADDIRQVNLAAGRAAALAQQLLAFSRQQVTSPKRIDLCGLVASLEPMLTRLVGRDICLTVECNPPNIEVIADRTQVEQVVLNLVVNARDAQPEGGRIDVKMGVEPWESLVDRFPEVTSEIVQSWVTLTVIDAGPGIPADVRDHMFEPFFTTKETGTGLGLSTVHGIVRQSGGYVTLYALSGGGTRADVILPSPANAQQQNEMARAGARETIRRPSYLRGNVLVYSDDVQARRNLRDALQAFGTRVLLASSMAEAAKCLMRETSLRIAVIDVRTSEQATNTLEQLRKLRPDLSAVVVGVNVQGLEHVEFVERYANPKALHSAVQRLGERVRRKAEEAPNT